MSIVPEKNGCNVYLDQYECYVHGDSYHFPNGVLVIRTCPEKLMGASELRLTGINKVHYRVPGITHWFDEHKRYGVLIADGGPLHRWEYYGYEGVNVAMFELAMS